MSYEPKSIEQQIDCLARLTGAPESFVNQVRQLFNSKGISLDDDAEPFVPALEEAFRREESIRCSTHRARQNLSKLQESFRKIASEIEGERVSINPDKAAVDRILSLMPVPGAVVAMHQCYRR